MLNSYNLIYSFINILIMSNFPPWYSSLQSFGWNSSPSVYTLSNPNHRYQTIAKCFLEKYFNANNFGIGSIGEYYHTGALCSIHLHKDNRHELVEVIGHANFVRKLNEWSIGTIKYLGIVPTVQPIGRNSILVSFHGCVEINNRLHNILTTLILRTNNNSSIIINQILDIFV